MKIKVLFQKVRYGLPAVAMAALAGLMLIPSCKDQDVTFKQYTVEGGITYLGAVSGLKARVGVNRLELNFSVADPATDKVGVFWNDYEDSIMIDVEPGDLVQEIIELPEGQYSLFVISYDARGNSSSPLELITKTVGPKYIATLGHRGFTKMTTGFNSDLYLVWAGASGEAGHTDFFYTSTDGTEKHIRIENEINVTETKLSDYKQGTTFRRITYYSPDRLWLDSILPLTEPEVRDMSPDKKIGRVIDYSSQMTGDEVHRFYDDEAGTVWQTVGGYPHYVTIDLGVELAVKSFGIVPSVKYTSTSQATSADPRAPTKVRFEGSTDNYTWTDIGEYPYDNGFFNSQRVFEPEEAVKARYIRFTGVECISAPLHSAGIGGPNTTKMVLAEFYVDFAIEETGAVYYDGSNDNVPVAPPAKTLPFKGPHILSAAAPCVIPLRDFDLGGEGAAFHDNNAAHESGNTAYRRNAGDTDSDPVDIEGGLNVAYTAAGEWLVYTVTVEDAGTYAVDVNMSVNTSSGFSFHFEVNNVNQTGTLSAPNNGSWAAYRWVYETNPNLPQPVLNLTRGTHKIKFYMETAGANIMDMRFVWKE